MTTVLDTRYLPDDFELTADWLPADDLVGDADMACIDGRHDGHIIGAPGGDAGEFILLLGALEGTCGLEFSARQIGEVLEQYLDRHGRFYLHTDRGALDKLTAAAGHSQALSDAFQAADSIDDLVAHPPEGVRKQLADLLVEPRHVGCGHLGTMLAHIDEFGVRRRLVADTMRAFFDALWRGRPEADFTILEGDHHESALVTFQAAQPVGPDTLIPAVWAGQDGPYLFANHQSARRYKRLRDLELVADVIDSATVDLNDDRRSAVLEEARRLADRQAAATMAHLAPDLAAYTVSYGDGLVV